MTKYKYVCDNCEDTENWNELLKPGFHCECGGHLHLVKTDNFRKIEGFDTCDMCYYNKFDQYKCITCSRIK